jgi:nucleoside-diphosphate-sugar epimerase
MDNEHWFIPSLINSLIEGRVFEMTSGEQDWSYLHAMDFASSVFEIISQNSLAGTINIGNPNPIKIIDVASEISLSLARPQLLNVGSLNYRPDQVMKLIPLIKKLSSSGWAPATTTTNRFADTVEWFSGMVPTFSYSHPKLKNSITLAPKRDIFQ